MKGDKSNRNMTMGLESGKKTTYEDASDVQPMENSGSRKSRKQPELPDGTKVSAGQIVAIKRREYGWSQEELSWRSGISVTQIGRIERGESIPSIKTILELERTLGIELYNMF